MTRFTVNLAFLFAELPYLERFAAVRHAGFEAVEFPWPELPLGDVQARVRDAGLRVGQLNMPAGDLAAGDRGFPNDPARVGAWRQAFETALERAAELGCPAVNVLAGNLVPGVDRGAQEACLRRNLAWALPLARRQGVSLLLEVLNPVDTPRYLLTELRAAEDLIAEAGDGLRLQFDTYQLAMTGADVPSELRRVAPLVGHVQVADVPGRGAPGSGKLDFAAFFDALADSEYSGCVGLEYHPATSTGESLAWLPLRARGWSGAPFRWGS